MPLIHPNPFDQPFDCSPVVFYADRAVWGGLILHHGVGRWSAKFCIRGHVSWGDESEESRELARQLAGWAGLYLSSVKWWDSEQLRENALEAAHLFELAGERHGERFMHLVANLPDAWNITIDDLREFSKPKRSKPVSREVGRKRRKMNREFTNGNSIQG